MSPPRHVLLALVAVATTLLLSPAESEQNRDVACSRAQVETAPETVIDPCSKIVERKASTAEERGLALFIRGKGYHNTKRFDLAAQDYDEAIKLTPNNEELFVSRANIAFRGRRMNEGVAFLQKALQLNQANSHALWVMGTLSDQSGDLDQAVRFYSMALASNPNDAYARFLRSRGYARLRQYDDALKDADALVAMAPDAINRQGFLDSQGDRHDFHVIALTQRAKLYDAIDQPVRAERDLTDAVAYKRSAESLAARGRYFAYRSGRENEALSDLDAAIGLDSAQPENFYDRGMVLLRLGHCDDALAAFDHALQIFPEFSAALRMRARTYRELDKTDQAVADMEHAIVLSPSILRETMPALRVAGYWQSKDDPTVITPALQDAIRACMLDKHCN